MASPTVVGTGGGTSGGAVQNHTFNIGSPANGDRVLIIGSFSLDDGDFTPTWPAGWTQFLSSHMAGGTYQALVEGRYRDCDGTEGATITVTSTNFEASAHNYYKITGYNGAQAPEVQATQDPDGADEFNDPPSLTPTGGSKDYLFLALNAWSRNRSVVAYPTNYSNGFSNLNTTARNAGVATAERALTASSEDPGTYEMSAVVGTIAVTIAVHPTAGTTGWGPLLSETRNRLIQAG